MILYNLFVLVLYIPVNIFSVMSGHFPVPVGTKKMISGYTVSLLSV